MNIDRTEPIEFFQSGYRLQNENHAAEEAGGSGFERWERIADISLDTTIDALAAATFLLPIAFIVGMVAVMTQ